MRIMEAMKKKLMGLLGAVPCEGPEWPDGCPIRRNGLCRQVDELDLCTLSHMAGHLMANGVAVNPWVSTAQRMPGEAPVLAVVSGRYRNITLRDSVELASWSAEEGWIIDSWPNWEDPKVTYWMEIPAVPGQPEPVERSRRALMEGMTDGELAALLLKQFDGSAYCRNLSRCDDLLENGMPIPEEDCMVCLLEWLQEVPEEVESLEGTDG